MDNWTPYRPPHTGVAPAGYDRQTYDVELRRDALDTWGPHVPTEPPLRWYDDLEYRYRVKPAEDAPAPRANSLPDDPAERNKFLMADGLLDYFPNALAYVSLVSKVGNDQHNPGQPMHHARGKSTDHRNKILRHLIDTGGLDDKGIRHSGYVAWRALANLQEELEAQEGAPLPRGAKPAE